VFSKEFLVFSFLGTYEKGAPNPNPNWGVFQLLLLFFFTWYQTFLSEILLNLSIQGGCG
jgi:hypothetical protein